MTPEEFDRRLRTWNELVRRFEQLGQMQEPSSKELGPDQNMLSVIVPPDDPTGLLELVETLRNEQIRESRKLLEEFPYYHSFFADFPPRQGKKSMSEAYDECSREIAKAMEFVNSRGLVDGKDYAIFSCVAGEVTAFHFKDQAVFAQFCAELGVIPDKSSRQVD